MLISLIAAMDKNQGIGKDGQLPWHLPEDLRHFRALTLGKPVVMGRRTYESVGHPLPKRQNIVVTRQADYQAPGCSIVTSVQAALHLADHHEEVMVLGGAEIFKVILPQADRMYLTLVDADMVADTYFPQWHKAQWQEIDSRFFSRDAQNQYNMRFITLERVRTGGTR